LRRSANHIIVGRIERVSCTKSSGEFQLLLGDVDRGHLRAKSSSELHRKVPQATYAENSQALTGHNPGALQGAITVSPAQKSGAASSAERPSGFSARELLGPSQIPHSHHRQ